MSKDHQSQNSPLPVGVDYSEFAVTEEEKNLYKFLYEEDGHFYQVDETGKIEDDDDYYYDIDTEEFYDLPDYCDKSDDDYDDDYQNDYLDDLEYEDRILSGHSSKGQHFNSRSQSSSAKGRKSGRSSKGSSTPGSMKKVSRSEDNLKSLDRRKARASEGSTDSNQRKHSVLGLLEASKTTNYWCIFDNSFQGVLEYGVVVKLLGNNQFEIFTGYQTVIGVTLRGFYNHYKRIEEGDVIVYQTIDSTLSFTHSKVYISANSEFEEIEILYRRGELSPRLYLLHKKMKLQALTVLASTTGNSLQDFLYPQRRSFHMTEESKRYQTPIDPTETPSGKPLMELKELYHFNQIILTRILEYFIDYLQKQPQMKSMIITMTNNTIRASASAQSLLPVQKTTPTIDATTTLSSSSTEMMGPKPIIIKSSQKLEKSKSKVGILLYLFFLESLHHLLYALPETDRYLSQSNQYHHTHSHSRILYGALKQSEQEKQRIQQLYTYAIASYNMNNCFGKLIRFLFQQILFYLFDNYPIIYTTTTISNTSSLPGNANHAVSPQATTSRSTLPPRTTSHQRYHEMVERICHMDIIINILPYLECTDIYQCLFLLFPQSVHQHLSQSRQVTLPVPLSMTTTTSVFGNLDNLKTIIQHFFREINQNTHYIGIANDIYDVFSCHMDWEQFLAKVQV